MLSRYAVAVGSALLVVGCSSESSAPAGPVNSSSSDQSKTPPAVVSVTPSAVTLVVGQSTQLIGKVTNRSGNVDVGRPITWASSAPAVATVGAMGIVNAITPGTSTITATTTGNSAGGTAVVTVVGAAQWRVQAGAPTEGIMLSVWGSSTGKVYATGPIDGLMTYFDGSAWSTVSSSVNNGTQSAFGFSDNAVFATGGNFIGTAYVLKYDGTSWSTTPGVPQDQFISGVWGTSPANLHATRADGSIIHFDGGSWSMSMPSTPARLESIFGTSAADIYAVGYNFPSGTIGYVFHFDGTSWSQVNLSAPGLSKVWASAANDVWVVGNGGFIAHFDGTTWHQTTSGTTSDLYGVYGTSGSDIMVVGAGGTILHYDGQAWSGQQSPTTAILRAVWGSSPGNYYAVGYGVVLRYSP